MEELILQGRVTINGKVVRDLATKVDPDVARIELDGELLRMETFVYYAVNKPKGYVSTNSDPSGRPRVIDILPDIPQRVYNVGRLDEGSTGLILLTNDGELANRLTHPRFGVEKVYLALVAGAPERGVIEKLLEGVWLSDGKARAKRARILGKRGDATTLEITLAEGKNREVRRMLAKLGHKIMSLTRIAVGPISVKGLKPGEFRPLSHREVAQLRQLAEGIHVPTAGFDERREARYERSPGGRGTRGPSRSQQRPAPSGPGRPAQARPAQAGPHGGSTRKPPTGPRSTGSAGAGTSRGPSGGARPAGPNRPMGPRSSASGGARPAGPVVHFGRRATGGAEVVYFGRRTTGRAAVVNLGRSTSRGAEPTDGPTVVCLGRSTSRGAEPADGPAIILSTCFTAVGTVADLSPPGASGRARGITTGPGGGGRGDEPDDHRASKCNAGERSPGCQEAVRSARPGPTSATIERRRRDTSRWTTDREPTAAFPRRSVRLGPQTPRFDPETSSPVAPRSRGLIPLRVP